MEGLLNFAVQTGIVAGCMMVNGAINLAAGKAIDKGVKVTLPERTPEMTDQQYLELVAAAEKKATVKKNIAKGVVGAVSLAGTSVGCSFALGAVSDCAGETAELPAEE